MTKLMTRLLAWLRSLDSRLKMLIGILFIALGLLALVTPLTPGSWLVFIGLEFIGIRLLAWRRLVRWARMRLGRADVKDDEEEERL